MKYVVPLAITFTLSLFASTGAAGALGSGQVTSCSVIVNAVGDGAEPEQDSYPRVAAIENALLGKSYATDDLEARLARLENEAFGKTSAQSDLGERTDELQQFVEKKLNRKLFQEDPEFQSTSNDAPELAQQPNVAETTGGGEQSRGGAPNRVRSVGTMLGTTLLNVAGLGVPGFGGVRVRNRADLPLEEQAAMQAKQRQETQEEPAVFEQAVPPDTAKLLTKVGWCEMQVFQRTFPLMHLPQRLTQLNGEINFAPGKTGIALMDSSAAMIEAVSRHQEQR